MTSNLVQRSPPRCGRLAWMLLLVGVVACGDTGNEPVSDAPAPQAPVGEELPPPGPPAGAALSHRRMLASLHSLRDRRADFDPASFYRGTRLPELEERILEAGTVAPPEARWKLRAEAFLECLKTGDLERARTHVDEASRLARTTSGQGWEDAIAESLYLEGLLDLRSAETRNCVGHHATESCVFPIVGGGVHVDKEPALRAVASLLQVLERQPDRVDAAWLLNIAAMTAGTFPDAVPERFRVPDEQIRSEVAFPAFEDIAHEVGLNVFSLAGGISIEDYDGDGLLDVFVSDWSLDGQLRFFRNAGSGGFEDRTEEAGLLGLVGGLNFVHADYDGDGHMDLLVLRGAWLGEGGRQPNSLLRNNGDGTFVDVAFAAGLGGETSWYPTQTAAWADYDLDGDLDLYVGNEQVPGIRHPSQLFRNRGDGTFEQVAREAGVENLRFTKAVVFGDFDGDRYPDLFVSNLAQPNRLYRNRGDGTFVDVAPELGLEEPLQSFPAWFWDFDNDGVLDLFVSGYGSDWKTSGLTPVASRYLRRTVSDPSLHHLYRGRGDGTFDEVGRDRGLVFTELPMGANFGDVDGDGYPDMYLGTGDPAFDSLMPNLLYHNQQGERFVDVTSDARVGHLQKGHGVAFADLDNDGDLDLLAEIGGAFRSDGFFNSVFRNPGFGHEWVTLRLTGTQSNRSAIGSRIHVVIREADGGERSIYRHVGSGGSFGASPLRQVVGLGKATGIERVEVFWPRTGKTQVFTDVPLRGSFRIVEGVEQLAPLPAPAITGW